MDYLRIMAFFKGASIQIEKISFTNNLGIITGNKYKGVFEQLEIKCIPLLFDKYKDTILQLKIYSDIYQVKCKDCEFFRPNIHTDLEKYRKHLFNIYSKIMNDPSWIVAQHMKGFENLHLDDVDKKKDIVNVSGTIIFEIVNK